MSRFLFALVLFLPGCATRVSTVAGAGSEPVAGARVSIACPQVIKASGAYDIGVTNERGELEFKEMALGRWIHDGCDVRVEKDGYRPKVIKVDDACVERWGTRCVRAVVKADLERASP